MAHDYAYGIRLDSEGSSTAFGADLDDVRIPRETTPGLRASPSVLGNRHGSTQPSRTFYDSYDFVLEVTLSYGSPATASDVYEHRSNVTARLTHHLEQVWLTRTAPYQGTVEIPILVRRPPRTTNPNHRIQFPCRTLEPFWRDTSVTFNAVNPVSGVTVGGDAPISDGVFVFSGQNGVQRLTHTTSGDYIELDTDTTSNAVTVDVGAGTVKQSGSHVGDQSILDAPEPWMIELQPGSNAFALSGGGSVTFTGRDKWL